MLCYVYLFLISVTIRPRQSETAIVTSFRTIDQECYEVVGQCKNRTDFTFYDLILSMPSAYVAELASKTFIVLWTDFRLLV